MTSPGVDAAVLPDLAAPDDMDITECGLGLDRCGAECVDLATSNDHCGSCGHACPVRAGTGGCEAGACRPVLSECIVNGDFDDPLICGEYCVSIGAACSDQCDLFGFENAFVYPGRSTCLENRERGSFIGCDMEIDVPSFVRCCCTVPD